MPFVREWLGMARETARSLRRDDVVGLYSREWKSARRQLVSEHREQIEGTRNGIRRFFRVVNAVAFGLVKRLAPARRLVFALAGLFMIGALVEGLKMGSGHRPEAEYWRLASHTVDFLLAAFVLMTFLLAMELIDKLQFRDELVLARELQRDLLPKAVPNFPGFELSAYNRIANMVGGDLYDFRPLPDGRLAVLFGDASGHGMAAGLVMAVAHAAFQTQLESDPSPDAIVGTLNRVLCRTGGPRSFFSCAYLLLAPDGSFSTTLAGHPPVLLVAPDGSVRREVGRGAYPLGIKTGLEWPPLAGSVEPGELLVFCSDGLAEARSEEGEEFGDARIAAIVRDHAWRAASDVVEALASAATRFCGREAPEDDVSILVIKRAPAPAAG
jgi:serine phosphatase RsbU (regulator of sigma subunit)